MALVRRFPRRWWVGGAVLVDRPDRGVRLGRRRSCWRRSSTSSSRCRTRSQARADVLELGREAGVDIGAGLPGRREPPARPRSTPTWTGSARPSASCSTTTCSSAPARPELRSVVAHELGHVAHDDIPRGILYVAIVAPLGLLFARELALAIARRTGTRPGDPGGDARLLARPDARLASCSTCPATSSRAGSRRAPTSSRSSSPTTPRR